MERLYQRHFVRKTTSLDGLWHFSKAKAGKPYGKEMMLAVPCAWESHPELCAYRGQGLYRREVQLHRAGSIRLYFGAVSHYAKVLWDGETVCEHNGAYTPFDCVLTAQTAGKHTLEVLADSSFDGRSALCYALSGRGRCGGMAGKGQRKAGRAAGHAVSYAGRRSFHHRMGK